MSATPTSYLNGMRVVRSAERLPWWTLLITGALWIVVSWLVLGFNHLSVGAIAALAGLVIIAAGLAELYLMAVAPGWKWLHGGLAVLFIITGIIAWANPGSTFYWLAALLGWYLLFKGAADIIVSFMTRVDNDAWWLGLIVGIIEVLLGFWAAGRFGRSAYLLVALVGVIALTRGITDIVMAFRLRRIQG